MHKTIIVVFYTMDIAAMPSAPLQPIAPVVPVTPEVAPEPIPEKEETIRNIEKEVKDLKEKQNIDNVSAVTQEVSASATETLDGSNMNLESIEKLMQIMEQLGADAKKLQKEA